jgi:uncharacterized protein
VRVPIPDIVDRPGASRPLRDSVESDAFGTDPWGPAEGALIDPVELDLHLDSVVDGVLVRGQMSFTLDLPCARCLVTQRQHRDVAVTELFIDPAKRDDGEDDEPGYELLDAATAIDLSTMVRDSLLLGLPLRILCREDCRGLCPTCGADRNVTDCGHADREPTDPRWSALANLDLPSE